MFVQLKKKRKKKHKLAPLHERRRQPASLTSTSDPSSHFKGHVVVSSHRANIRIAVFIDDITFTRVRSMRLCVQVRVRLSTLCDAAHSRTRSPGEAAVDDVDGLGVDAEQIPVRGVLRVLKGERHRAVESRVAKRWGE